MPSYEQMQEDTKNLGRALSRKCNCCTELLCLKILLGLALIVIIGLSIGISLRPNVPSGHHSHNNSIFEDDSPSCPPLRGELLLSGVDSSFEGFRQSLICKSGYSPFPKDIQCIRQEGSLRWSHLPVCILDNPDIEHFGNSVCLGNSSETTCSMICKNNYIPVDSEPYSCSESPCPRVNFLGEKAPPYCFLCDQKCDDLNGLPSKALHAEVLTDLGCSSECSNVIISTKGNYSSRLIFVHGLYSLVGEHGGYPLYQRKINSNYFHNYKHYEWLVGNNLSEHIGMFRVVSNTRSSLNCPGKLNDEDINFYYYDYISTDDQGWKKDDLQIHFECWSEKKRIEFTCPCRTYSIMYSSLNSTSPPSKLANYIGKYTINTYLARKYNHLSQVYEEPIKHYSLYSNDGHFQVWTLGDESGTGYAVGYLDSPSGGDVKTCPDHNGLTWEWYNATTPEGLNHYVKDPNLFIKCIDKM